MTFLEKHPMIMIIIGIFGISLSAIFVKYSTAPSDVTAAWRLIWTVFLMTPIVFGKKEIRREMRSVSHRNRILSMVSGVFLAIHLVVWFESLQHTSVASSTTIVCTEVIWVCLGYCLFLRGKISLKALVAIVVTLTGSVLIALSDSSEGRKLYGDILALIAAMATAVYTLIGRQVRKNVSTTVYTYLVYFACGAAIVVTSLCMGHSLVGYGWSAVLVGLLLAVFSTILGHSIFSWCLKFFSPSFVSASKLCEPVGAAILAVFLFGEIPAPLQLLGGIIILVGVWFYSRVERQEQRSKT